MKEVFEKIIERLEENNLKSKRMKNQCIALSDIEVSDIENHAYNTAIEIVKEVAEEFGKDKYVSIGAYKQVAWERDIAIEQLHELGYEFGQKIEEEYCEWRLCDEQSNVYDTSCRNPHILIDGSPSDNRFEYCPYCGKRIKEVE